MNTWRVGDPKAVTVCPPIPISRVVSRSIVFPSPPMASAPNNSSQAFNSRTQHVKPDQIPMMMTLTSPTRAPSVFPPRRSKWTHIRDGLLLLVFISMSGILGRPSFNSRGLPLGTSSDLNLDSANDPSISGEASPPKANQPPTINKGSSSINQTSGSVVVQPTTQPQPTTNNTTSTKNQPTTKNRPPTANQPPTAIGDASLSSDSTLSTPSPPTTTTEKPAVESVSASSSRTNKDAPESKSEQTSKDKSSPNSVLSASATSGKSEGNEDYSSDDNDSGLAPGSVAAIVICTGEFQLKMIINKTHKG